MSVEPEPNGARASETSGREGPTSKGQDICERTFAFAVRIVNLCQSLDKIGGAGKMIGRQLLRSGTSIGANMEEAQGGQSRADFISKCGIARKEARESLYWIRLLGASKVVEDERLASIAAECNELVAIMTAIIKKTQERK